MKIQNLLKYYTDKIATWSKFSLARYGDGEILCMIGKKGGNSNGCAYTPELREALMKSMEKRPNFIHGLQRVLPHDEKRMLERFPDIEWHDTEIFSEAVAVAGDTEDFKDFLSVLQGKQVMIIGNFSIRDATKDLLPNRWFFEVPPSNAFEKKAEVLEAVRWNNRFNKDVVYLFSCGMAANAFISELHGEIDGWLIDVGHIWDPFAGSKSRCDLV